MMPPDPQLFTEKNVDSRTVQKRMDLWVDKTIYVLDRMNRIGYCRMATHDALTMVDRIAERMSGLVNAYRHIVDEHLVAAFVRHIITLSDLLIPTHRLLKTHDLLIGDLYSRASLRVDRMTSTHVACFLLSYDVFKSDVAKIRFKSGTPKYSETTDHEAFIRKLLSRLDETLHLARPQDLLDSLTGIHTIDSKLTQNAGRIFERLALSYQIERASLGSVAEALHCLGLWGVGGSQERKLMVEGLVERINIASAMDIKELRPTAFGKMMFGLGQLQRHGALEDTERLKRWLGDRLNGYSMLPRDLTRIVQGFAALNAFDPALSYLVMKQAVRRAGYFRRGDARILCRAVQSLEMPGARDLEDSLVTGDRIQTLRRFYGHR